MIGSFLGYIGIYLAALAVFLWGLHRYRHPIDKTLGDFFDKDD